MFAGDFEQFVATCTERAKKVRYEGRKEYANSDDVFGNFNRLANLLNLSRLEVCFTYGMKHFDGIASYVRGHTKQRDSIQGRFDDLHNYLWLMEGMIHEDESNKDKD